LISVIIRTKNEQEWIRQCLVSVFSQVGVQFEVVVVDNESSDDTLSIVKEFPVKLINITQDDWSYGRALNKGIAASSGEYLVCLSGHCFPVNQHWLLHMLSNFSDSYVAGVYGRQEPICSTSIYDKRDMWNTLGVEKKVQNKDPFFHNANSMLKRSIWARFPFDEQVSGVEDRIWAKQILSKGYKIVYEPLASVYHPHGLNQVADQRRCARVIDVIEKNRLNRSVK